jgi:hypothetical protein
MLPLRPLTVRSFYLVVILSRSLLPPFSFTLSLSLSLSLCLNAPRNASRGALTNYLLLASFHFAGLLYVSKRCTAPLLVDTATGAAVSNESGDLVRMLANADLGQPDPGRGPRAVFGGGGVVGVVGGWGGGARMSSSMLLFFVLLLLVLSVVVSFWIGNMGHSHTSLPTAHVHACPCGESSTHF